MPATEAQKAGLAKARANLAAKRAAEKALEQQNREERSNEDDWSAHLASEEVRNAATLANRKEPENLHDPTGEAFANALEPEPDMPDTVPVLDPAIATPPKFDSTDEPPLVSAARKMLKSVEVRRGDGELMLDRCQLCEDTGIHHTVPYRCACGCHELRDALMAVV